MLVQAEGKGLSFVFFLFSGIQGHSADSVELAAADYEVHRYSSQRECSIQPGMIKHRLLVVLAADKVTVCLVLFR